MTKKKQFILMLAMLSLIFTLNMVESTFAKYISRSSGEAEVNIARWDIKVNNEQIRNNTVLTADISPDYENNDNVEEGYIAPGSIAYFEVKIDPNETDVPFNYEISIGSDVDSSVSDFKLYKYKINGVETNTDVGNSISENIIPAAGVSNVKTIIVYVIWEDGTASELMDDEADTQVGHDAANGDAEGLVKVKLKFKQIEGSI